MSEIPTSEEVPQTPASPEEVAIRDKAKEIGEAAARQVIDMLAGLEFRTGSMTWWPHDAARKAEAEALHQHGLIDDAELERRSTPPEIEGGGRGLTSTI